jgi:hypothetical protein
MTRAGARAVAAVVTLAWCVPAPAQTLRLGETVRLEPKARVHADLRSARDHDDADDVDLDLARRRVGVKGRVTSRVQFEVEREIDTHGGWRDAFVNVRASRAVQVRAGHFKVPFSREQLTGAGRLDFIDRSRAAALLAPGRSAGVAVHGRAWRRVVGYEAGAFAGEEPAVAGRLTLRPRGGLEIGVAAVSSRLDEGRTSLRGRLTSRDVFFAPVLVSGRRLRVGGDLDWRPGPFGIRAEFLRADDARQHQGLLGETLAPLRGQGWYVSGVWAVSGVRGVELAARAEQVSFGTPGAAAGHAWTPRAEQLSTVTDRAWTFGVNWTVHRLIRVQANAVREDVTTRARGAVPPKAGWAPAVRVQVAL